MFLWGQQFEELTAPEENVPEEYKKKDTTILNTWAHCQEPYNLKIMFKGVNLTLGKKSFLTPTPASLIQW